MWIWHVYLGYLLVVLYVIRFSLPLFEKMKFQNPSSKEISKKEKFQNLVYIIFYITSTRVFRDKLTLTVGENGFPIKINVLLF